MKLAKLAISRLVTVIKMVQMTSWHVTAVDVSSSVYCCGRRDVITVDDILRTGTNRADGATINRATLMNQSASLTDCHSINLD